MKKYENGFYENAKDWDFSAIGMTEEIFTDWDMTKIINQFATEDSRILDLGTGGGEKVLQCFPEVKEILGTDLSGAMIKTAEENLKKSGRKNIIFRKMDNLKMNTPSEYFDIVVARHTCIDPVQIFKTLKPGGILIVRGVDQLDCWELKRMFGRGQAYRDGKSISQVDFEATLDAGFKDTELVPIHIREYYRTPKDLFDLLNKAPILEDFSEIHPGEEYMHKEIGSEIFDRYVREHSTKRGVLLVRRYYGITARKP